MIKRAKKSEAKKREAAGGRAISGDVAAAATKSQRKHIARPNILHSYLDHRQINQYLEYLAGRYAHFVKLHHLGHSHERRELRGIEIDWMNADNTELPAQQRMRSAPLNARDDHSVSDAPMPFPHGPHFGEYNRGRNIVFIEAGTHAREWITVTTALNCIYQLTERYTRNIEVLRKLRFFIVPLVNPDGYEYSRIKNRQWRKNRRPHKQAKIIGTDCNRNYDIFWESGPTRTHRVTYKGEKPFSEPETRAVRNILEKLKLNLLFFLSLHSYGQSIMYPWAYSREPIEYQRELNLLANAGRAAIKTYNGREYRTGSISGLTKRTITGSVVDYVYAVLKAPLALVMELPSQSMGFQPPVDMISKIGHESWFGIREMCKCAFDLRSQINRDREASLPIPSVIIERRASGGDNDATAVAAPKKPKTDNQSIQRIGSVGAGDNINVTPTKRAKRRLKKKGSKSKNDAATPPLVKHSTGQNSRLSAGSRKKSNSAKSQNKISIKSATSAPVTIASDGTQNSAMPPARIKTAPAHTNPIAASATATAADAPPTDANVVKVNETDNTRASAGKDGPTLKILDELKSLSAYISGKF